jgi:hypothetical protein
MGFMEANIRSPRAMSDMINRFYDGLELAGNPKQGDLLGGGAPSKSALLDNAIATADGQPTASAIVDAATQQQREAALRTAVGQAEAGRAVDVEPVFRPDADVASSVARQSSPESIRVADMKSLQAAEERLAAAPKSEALADAEAELGRVMADLQERYVSISTADGMVNELQVYDDAIKSSEELGRAARAAAVCDLRG